MEGNVEPGASLRWVSTGPQAANGDQPPVVGLIEGVPAPKESRHSMKWQPEVGLFPHDGSLKSWRRHTDNDKGDAIQCNAPADDGRIQAEPSLPEIVAYQRDRLGDSGL